jgi:hypothetical protein
MIVAEPGTEFVFPDTSSGLIFTGGFQTSTTLATAINRWDDTIETVAAHGASVGDLVRIYGAEPYEAAFGLGAARTSHTSVVIEVISTTEIRLADSVLFDFPIGTTVNITTNLGRLSVSGLYTRQLYTASLCYGMLIRQVKGVRMDNCRASTNGNPGGQSDPIQILESYDLQFNRMRVWDGRYGILCNRCFYVGVFNSEFNELRHSLAPTNATNYTILDNVWGSCKAIIDSHGSFNGVVRNVWSEQNVSDVNLSNFRGYGLVMENVYVKSNYPSTPTAGVFRFGPQVVDGTNYVDIVGEYDMHFKHVTFDAPLCSWWINNQGGVYIDDVNVKVSDVQIGSSDSAEYGVRKLDRRNFRGYGDLKVFWPQHKMLELPKFWHGDGLTQYTGTVDASSSGTTVDLGDNFGLSDGDLIGWGFYVDSGTGAGASSYRRITDFVSATNTITVDSAITVDTDSTYIIDLHEIFLDKAVDWGFALRQTKVNGHLLGGNSPTTNGIKDFRPRRVRLQGGYEQPFSWGSSRSQEFFVKLTLIASNSGGSVITKEYLWKLTHDNVSTAGVSKELVYVRGNDQNNHLDITNLYASYAGYVEFDVEIVTNKVGIWIHYNIESKGFY